MTKQIRWATVALGLAAGMWMVRAQAVPTGEPAPVLVELFTSEGCSSCPPADRVLQQLNGTRSRTGARVIVLSEHVTYWDHLGWKDRFSDNVITARQSAYGDRFRLDSVYTPQTVVNGRIQLVGSDAAGVRRAIDVQPDVTEVRLHIANVSPDADGITVRVDVDGAPKRDAVLYAVIAQDMASTPVQRGENSGRTLTHVSIVRTLLRTGPLTGPVMPVHLTAAELRATDGQKRHLVVFAQSASTGPILAADSISLEQ